jgi:glucose-6-phosphate isomerase
VEAGKQAAARVLDLLGRALLVLREERGRAWGLEELAKAMGEEAEVETIFQVLRHAAANPDHGVLMSSAPRPWESLFSAR